jgi:hypothetical protein
MRAGHGGLGRHVADLAMELPLRVLDLFVAVKERAVLVRQ